jgi:uncharacterized small protein (DUF1192 family)
MTIACMAVAPLRLAKRRRPASDTWTRPEVKAEVVSMAEEELVQPRRQRGWAIVEAAREDLELLGIDELEERIEALEVEIGRTRAQITRKQAGRAAADAFFSKPG